MILVLKAQKKTASFSSDCLSAQIIPTYGYHTSRYQEYQEKMLIVSSFEEVFLASYPVFPLNGRKYPLVYVRIFSGFLTCVSLEETNDLMEVVGDCFQAHD